MQVITSHNALLPEKGFIATVGMFDGVHKGHRYLIDRLGELAKENSLKPLIVTFANHPLSIIKPNISPRMLTTVSEKMLLLEWAGAEYCYLMEFNDSIRQMTAFQFMSFLKDELNVKGLLAGFNHKFGNDRNSGPFTLEESASRAGIEFFRGMEYSFNRSMKISSSRIRDLLAKNDVTVAMELLGRPYEVTGKITEGRKIGRTIGFPTANLMADSESKIIPGNGVYGGTATIHDEKGRVLPAMVNIGFNPTVSTQDKPSIEAHIIGLPEDTNLYGVSVTLSFRYFLRHEHKFDSLESLKTQLHTDKQQILKAIQL